MFQTKKTSNIVPELKFIIKNKNWINKIITTMDKKNILNKQFLKLVKKTLKIKKASNSFHVWQLINIYLFLNHYKNLRKKQDL